MIFFIIEQILQETHHKTAAVRPLTTYLKKQPSKKKTCGTLLEKQGRTHK